MSFSISQIIHSHRRNHNIHLGASTIVSDGDESSIQQFDDTNSEMLVAHAVQANSGAGQQRVQGCPGQVEMDADVISKIKGLDWSEDGEKTMSTDNEQE